jgi:hypothetical protein
MTKEATTLPLPEWMTVDHDTATIRLRHPREFNGVKVDRIKLESPNIRLVRACRKAHPTDEEAEEMMLLSSMTKIPIADLDLLDIKDYGRLQQGYFRLYTDDGL